MKSRITGNKKDAWGKALLDCFYGAPGKILIERDDGLRSHEDLKEYLEGYKKFPPREKKALKYVRGKILDLGCGAGRHVLYLQKKKFNVTGIDISPLSIKVCRLRGCKDVKVMDMKNITTEGGKYDTILMLCNNFGLFGTVKKAKMFLKKFNSITNKNAVIIADSWDYRGFHPGYIKFNKRKNRSGGYFKAKIHYGRYVSDWFEYLRVYPGEMKQLIKGTGWKIKKIIKEGTQYIAILNKTKRGA